MDIPSTDIRVGRVPMPPEGYEIDRVDVVVRLRRSEELSVNKFPKRSACLNDIGRFHSGDRGLKNSLLPFRKMAMSVLVGR